MDRKDDQDLDILLTHAPFVRQTARALLEGDGRVDDVVQDTFVVALTWSPRRPSALRAWLGGVVRNLAFTIRRRDAARDRREAVAAERRRPFPSPEEIAEREEARRRMIEAVLALEEPYRTAVLLRYYEDLPPREIAHRLGVPTETARTRVRRGLGLLRERLDRDHDGDRGTWMKAMVPLLFLPGGIAAAATASGAGAGNVATRIGGGLAVSTNVKLGIAVVVLVLLCAGAAVWQLRPTGPAKPPGAETEGERGREPEIELKGRDDPSNLADSSAGAAPDSAGTGGPVAGAPGAAAGGEPAGDADATSSSGAGQPGFTPRMWTAGPAGTVEGSVEVAGSGEGLPGVEVWLERDGPMSDEEEAAVPVLTVTDEQGAFSFADLPAGTYRLRITHPDYAHVTRTGVRIDDKSGIGGIVLALAGDSDTFGVIEGTVTTSDRTPVAGARVVVHAESPSVRVDTVTDENGYYRVERLLAGFYRVSLLEEAEEGAPEESGELFRRFIITTVRPRETSKVDFRGTGTLIGIVTDADDQPMEGLKLELVPIDRTEGYKVKKGVTDATGTARIENAGIGPHEVWIQSMKEGWSVWSEAITLTGNDQECRLRLETGVVEGRLSITDGDEAVPPAAKRLYPGILLHPADPEHEGRFGSHRAIDHPDHEGRFRFRGIRPGRYRLKVFLNGYVTEERDIEVAWGDQRAAPLDIAMRKLRVGTCKLTVKDPVGKPVDGLVLHYGTKALGYRNARFEKPEPGVYLAETVEVGTWILRVSREDLKPAQADLTIIEGEITEIAVTMEPK